MKVNKFFQKVDDSFLKNNVYIFKKYKPIKKIGKGSFGSVYLVKRIKDKKLFAMKTEKNNMTKKKLEEEAFILYTLQGFGIPKFISYGKTKNYNILIEELLDKNLNELMEIYKKLSLKDVCLIGIQILDRLEWIHSKNIIYRDIKPENFLIGKDDPYVIYIIDFGLCKKYRSSKTGKHILPRKTGVIDGTIKYLSIHVLRGKEPSRRDDLISLGYMLIYLFKGSLPWDTEMKDLYAQIYKKFFYLKSTNLSGNYFNNLPKEFVEYVNYSNNLKFDQDPDYDYLRSLFNNVLFKLKFNYKNMSFSWITSKQINLLEMPRNDSLRRSKCHSRLYKKIIENSELRTKSESAENIPKNKISNTKYRLNNSPMDKINTIFNVKSENNIRINIKNNEVIKNIFRNANINNNPFKIKKKILKNKIDKPNSPNYNRINFQTLTNNSNYSNNYINSLKNSISNETIPNINQNINNKNNLFFKNKSNLRKIKNFSINQNFPINYMSNHNSIINNNQNIFNSTLKNLKYNNSNKINYLIYDSNKNSIKEEKKIKNNINNSSLKSVVQRKNFNITSPGNKIKINKYNHIISLSNSKKKSPIYSTINVGNHNKIKLKKSNIRQNRNLANKNIKIIYINNNYNYIGNKKSKNDNLYFSNQNIMNEEGKYPLHISKRNRLINLNNKNNFKISRFSNNNYNINNNKNITYKNKFKIIEEDIGPFSEYKTSVFDKYFENN